jgi:hypothetical protein
MVTKSFELLNLFMEQYCEESGAEAEAFWMVEMVDRGTDGVGLDWGGEVDLRLVKTVVDCHNAMICLLRAKDLKRGN